MQEDKDVKKLSMVICAVLAAQPVHAFQPAPDAGRMFALIDSDGNGTLDRAEVTKMLELRARRTGNDQPIEPAMVDRFMKRADVNADGMIAKDELEALRRARAERQRSSD